MKSLIRKIYCDENSCTVRYYQDNNILADGLIRAQYRKNQGRLNQNIITITEMSVNNILANFNDVMEIRNDAIELIRQHLAHDQSQSKLSFG